MLRTTVPPVAAPVTERPAACDAVFAVTANTGFDAPLGPTVKAFADAEVIVVAPVFAMLKSCPVDEPMLKMSVGPPATGLIESRAYGEVEPMPKFPLVSKRARSILLVIKLSALLSVVPSVARAP